MTSYINKNGEEILDMGNGFKIGRAKQEAAWAANQVKQANRKLGSYLKSEYIFCVENGLVDDIDYLMGKILKYSDGEEWLDSLN